MTAISVGFIDLHLIATKNRHVAKYYERKRKGKEIVKVESKNVAETRILMFNDFLSSDDLTDKKFKWFKQQVQFTNYFGKKGT